MTRLMRTLAASRLVRLVALLVLALAGGSLATGAALAQDADRNPADIAIAQDEAGKSLMSSFEEEGTDGYGRWIHRRWERDRDNEDIRVGPTITDNKVWITRDVQAAQALFKEQAGKMMDFPESVDRHKSPFAFNIEKLGDEIAALSACIDCDTKGSIDLHQRVVIRKGSIVTVMYIFGRETVATQEAMMYFVNRLVDRI